MSVLAAMAPAVISAGASLWNVHQQRRTQQETWRREDTAVQRRARDLRQAGINPILAAGQAAQAGPTQAPQADIDAQQMLLLHRQQKQVQAQTEQSKADKKRIDQETEYRKAETRRAYAEADMTEHGRDIWVKRDYTREDRGWWTDVERGLEFLGTQYGRHGQQLLEGLKSIGSDLAEAIRGRVDAGRDWLPTLAEGISERSGVAKDEATTALRELWRRIWPLSRDPTGDEVIQVLGEIDRSSVGGAVPRDLRPASEYDIRTPGHAVPR